MKTSFCGGARRLSVSRTVGGTTRIMKENTFLYAIGPVFSLDPSHLSLQPNDEQEQDRLDLVGEFGRFILHGN